ncbi:MAG: hypothetical protein OEU68_18970 [Nitrospira sp.]|nr:hypothetical protein [Nitrospira sp.]
MRCRCAGRRLILERLRKGRDENGPFSLKFCQIVALMFPYRSVIARSAQITDETGGREGSGIQIYRLGDRR